MKKVSLDKIAKSLGVSKTLVSLVINKKSGKYGISEETRLRVMKKVEELNYHPNIIARGLRTGKSNVIGLVVADIANPFYSKISRSIEDKVSKLGYHLLVCSSDEDPEKEKNLIQFLVNSQQVSGLIISPTQEKKEVFMHLKKRNYPFVLIDRYLPGFKTNSVTVDNYAGSLTAVEHLIKTGFRKIGMLAISPHHLSSINDRIRGYKDALKENKIPFDKKLVREIPFNTAHESVREELRDLLNPPHSIDALFVVNNNLAVSCLETFVEMGLSIPQDLAVISFDDVDVFRFSYPPLTAIAQPLEEIGQKAVDLLFEKINDEKSSAENHVVLPTKLVIRKSCGSFLKSN